MNQNPTIKLIIGNLLFRHIKKKKIITTNHFILYLRPVVLLNVRFKVYVALIDQSIVSFPQFIYQ